MPQRFLRPGIRTSDAWNAVSFPAQSLYIRLLTLVDDFGRYDGRLKVIHGECFALRDDIKPQQTAALRSELQTTGLVDIYSVDGKEYLQITKWQERTRSEHSKYPDPQDSAAERSVPQEKDASLAIAIAIASTSSPSPSNIVPASAPAAFRSAFEEWMKFRKGIGKKPKDWNVMFQKQVTWLAQFDDKTALEILSQSIRNGWTGLFVPKTTGANGQQQKPQTNTKLDREFKEAETRWKAKQTS